VFNKGGNDMSAYLGPIHHWLFKKIQIFELIEKDIISSLKSEFPNIQNNITQITDIYGEPTPDLPLDQIIDEGNIHGWLQGQITKAELRQAALITFAYDKHGDRARQIVQESYRYSGNHFGSEAKQRLSDVNAINLYKIINDYILEGMPCDNIAAVTSSTPQKVEWKQEGCLHKNYWDEVEGSIDEFYKLRTIWITAFISSITDDYRYSSSKEGSTYYHIIQMV
jgi:hypothetical protein